MDYDQYLNAIKEQINLNNSWSAAQAQKQMDFQERMSNTAHQREIFDLQAAGLNPVLSANAGASSPSGAQGTVDPAATSSIANMLSTIIDTENANARAALAAAAKGSGTSSSAAGNNNFLTDLLMAVGLNKTQATGIGNTVDNLTGGSFNAKDLFNNVVASLTGNKNGSNNSSNSSTAKITSFGNTNGVSWNIGSAASKKAESGILASAKNLGYQILRGIGKGIYNLTK